MNKYAHTPLLLPEPDMLLSGSVLLGQALLSGRPVVMDEDSLTRHTLVVGTTGSGKTELLLGMAESAILSGGGVLFVDGKGDHSTWARLYSMAKAVGREEDLLMANFGKGVSNTWNPFASLSDEELASMLIASLPVANGDGVMWQQRATNLMRTVCMTAYSIEDHVAPYMLRNYMELNGLINAINHPLISKKAKAAIKAYFSTLPGFDITKASKQSQTTLDQHGYLTMQWTAALGLLCDTYEHIFTEPAEIELSDVLRSRRIMYVSLPSMARSSADISLLGSLVFSSLRTAMMDLMPGNSEGGWNIVAQGGTPRGLPPLLCIMDEVGHYMTDGMGVMAAQARSLGVSLVFATQDLESMTISNSREASMILSNVGTRVLMRQVRTDNPSLRSMMPADEGGPERRMRSIRHDLDHKDISLRIMAASMDANAFVLSGKHEKAVEVIDTRLLPMVEELSCKNMQLIHEAETMPEWNLERMLRSLGMGEFIVIQGQDFIVCRAFHASQDIKEVNIVLNRPSSCKVLSVVEKPISLDSQMMKQIDILLNDGIDIDTWLVQKESETNVQSLENTDFLKRMMA